MAEKLTKRDREMIARGLRMAKKESARREKMAAEAAQWAKKKAPRAFPIHFARELGFNGLKRWCERKEREVKRGA